MTESASEAEEAPTPDVSPRARRLRLPLMVALPLLVLIGGGIVVAALAHRPAPAPPRPVSATLQPTMTVAPAATAQTPVTPVNASPATTAATARPTSVNAQLFANPSAPVYVPGKGFTPDAQRVLDIVTLQGALEKYRGANKRYPATLADLFPAYAPVAGGKTLTEPPTDPETHKPYDYQVSADGATYRLAATLSSGKQYTGITVDTP